MTTMVGTSCTRKHERLATYIVMSALAACSSSTSARPDDGDATRARVTVRYEASLGTLDPALFGVQGLGADGSDARVAAAGFRILTTHAPAYESAEPLGYSSATLASMDRDVAAFVALGAEPWLYFYQIRKPDDQSRYSDVVAAIVAHVKETFPTAHPIFFLGNEPDWEVMQCAGSIRTDFKSAFWDGTREEFFATYATFARAVKSVDPSFVTGGAGVANPVLDELPDDAPDEAKSCSFDADFSGRRGDVNRWVTDFLDYCRDTSVPLDFFAFHAYSPAPYRRYYDYATKLADVLAGYPTLSPLYGPPKLATNEWSLQLTDDVGIGGLCSREGGAWDEACVARLESMKTAHKSAHHVVALIDMIDGGIAMNAGYSAVYQSVADRGTDAAKRDANGSCRYFTLVCADSTRNAYHAFMGFNWLAGYERLETTGSDHLNLAALAGRASDGSVIVAIGNWDVEGYTKGFPASNPVAAIGEAEDIRYFERRGGVVRTYDAFRVTLDEAPWRAGEEIVVEQYAVDEQHLLEVVNTQTLDGASTLVIDGTMGRPSVQFLKIRRK